MANIKLTLAYDGKNYLGWQKTRMGPSIEEALELTLQKILQEKSSLQAASRTDAGVHAHGQVVNFFLNKEISLEKLQISLNSLLPKDISVRKIEEVDPLFHPTLSNCGKEYRYYLCTGPVQLPQYRHYSWHCHYPLNLSEMHLAAKHFIGTYDFKAFCNFKKNARYATTVRTVTNLEILELDACESIEESEGRILFKISGSSFLYKMVRNIVGTLVQVGKGILKAKEIPTILESGDRKQAGVAAPAHGLTLHRVFYES